MGRVFTNLKGSIFFMALEFDLICLSKQDVHMNLIMENVHDFYERKKYMKLAVN